jgi:hypothetical protein
LPQLCKGLIRACDRLSISLSAKPTLIRFVNHLALFLRPIIQAQELVIRLHHLRCGSPSSPVLLTRCERRSGNRNWPQPDQPLFAASRAAL